MSLKKTKLTAAAMLALIPLSVGVLGAAPAQAATNVPASFTFNGAGWGHGVGMSQYGAYGMAQHGYTATQILEHYYNPAKVSTVSTYANSDIRVQVLNSTTTSTITPKDGSLRLKFDKQTITSTGAVTFTLSGGKINITVNGKSYKTSPTTGVMIEWQNTRAWTSGSQNTTISLPKANDGSGTVAYRHGKMEVKELNKKLNFVNILRLNDEYMYGLAEVPSSWADATLQAQAIAGRTYAMKNMSLKASCNCNVYDEVQSQKFTAWNKENEANGVVGKRWVAAVNKTLSKNSSGTPTSAKVIKYNGALIDAVYSSSTGGKTRSSKSVWGSEHAYLQSRDDHWALEAATGNPNRAWTGTATQAQVAKAYGLSNVTSISVAKNSDGTIYSSTATSSTGAKKTLTGSATRTLFGAKSTWVTSIKPSSSTTTTIAPTVSNTTTVKSGVSYKTLSGLNMRSGNSTAFGVVQVLPVNATVVSTGRASSGWLEVKYGARVGWVSTSYIQEVKAATTTTTTPAKTTTPAPAKTTTPTKTAPAVTVKPKKSVAVKTYKMKANTTAYASYATSSKKTTLKKNTKVTTTGYTVGNWREIKVGSKKYWVTNANQLVQIPVKTASAKTYVMKANTKAYASYSTKSKAVTLKKFAKVTTTGYTYDKWAEIKVGSKKSWITNPSQLTSLTKKVSANLNFRKGAGTKYSSIKVLKKNSSVTLTGKVSGSWVQVKVGSKTGWVASSYLK